MPSLLVGKKEGIGIPFTALKLTQEGLCSDICICFDIRALGHLRLYWIRAM